MSTNALIATSSVVTRQWLKPRGRRIQGDFQIKITGQITKALPEPKTKSFSFGSETYEREIRKFNR